MDASNIFALQPLVALVIGVLILLVPRLLNYFIAIYLIFIGVSGLWPQLL
ncbi:MAG: DUF3096 domain-containing protein [Micropepsaceae bacterium]